MALESLSLLELVETLRERIDEHGTLLGQNEMRTRYALIDPLLRELGWNTSDPAEVVVEEGSGNGRADYLLIADSSPVMIIEAKRLGLGVRDGRQQAAIYAMDVARGARYFTVTDGNHWEIYDTHQPAINMMIISFAVREERLSEVCSKALALARPRVQADSNSVAHTPVIQPEVHSQQTPEEPPEPVYSTGTPQQPSPRISEAVPVSEDRIIDSNADWTTLSKWVIKRDHEYPCPAEIEFPDGSRVDLGTWNKLVTETVRWLMDSNHLNQSHSPIQYATKYLLADTPNHPNGEGFIQPKQVGRLYIETKYTSYHHVRNTKTIIKHVGRDPAQFKVRFPS